MHTLPLPKHLERIDGISDTLCMELDSAPVPDIIYHYTDDSGLRGILSTGQLWFTDLFDLNDPSELSHGFGHALELLKKKVEDGPPEAKVFHNVFERGMMNDVNSSANFFVCCFSTSGDALGQWRAYADDGRGYAMGFDAKSLEMAFTASQIPEAGSCSTFPVYYDDRKMCEIYSRLIEGTLQSISAAHGMDLCEDSLFLRSIAARLASNLIMISSYFKHEGYRGEQEYRFFRTYRSNHQVPDLQLRTRPYALVRYIEFDWRTRSPNLLAEIVCGPSSDQRQAIKFVQDCLREYLPTADPAIERSKIPYRSLRT